MDDKQKDLTLGERVVNWARAVGIVLPLMMAAVASTLGYFKSDDAQKEVGDQWEKLEKRVLNQERVINAQSAKVEKLAHRMIFFQGHQAGLSAGKLYEKSEKLEKQLDKCKVQKAPRSLKKDELLRILKEARSKNFKPKATTKVQQLPRILPRPFKASKK